MKYFSQMALVLSLVTASSFATSLHPDTFRQDAAPVLSTLKVSEVEQVGKILKNEHHHPYSTFLIAIPVSVNLPDACTDFVGQDRKAVRNQRATHLRAVGASSPLADACIQIAVGPVKTHLTVEMQVLTGGFVAADDVQTMLVNIENSGTYEVILDMSNDSVRIRRVR